MSRYESSTLNSGFSRRASPQSPSSLSKSLLLKTQAAHNAEASASTPLRPLSYPLSPPSGRREALVSLPPRKVRTSESRTRSRSARYCCPVTTLSPSHSASNSASPRLATTSNSIAHMPCSSSTLRMRSSTSVRALITPRSRSCRSSLSPSTSCDNISRACVMMCRIFSSCCADTDSDRWRFDVGDTDTSSTLVTSASDDLRERTPAERTDIVRGNVRPYEVVGVGDGAATSGRGDPMNEPPQPRSRGGFGGGFRRIMCGVVGALTELRVRLSSKRRDEPFDEMPDSPSDEWLLPVSPGLASGDVADATNGVDVCSGCSDATLATRRRGTKRRSGTAEL